MRTDHAVAFLDIRPVFPGHTLVVPPVHVDTFPDLPAAALSGYFAEVQRLSIAVPAAAAPAPAAASADDRPSPRPAA